MKRKDQRKSMLVRLLSMLMILVTVLPLAAQEVRPQSQAGDLDVTFVRKK